MPEECDSYWSVAKQGTGKVTVKMSRFLSFAIPVESADKAREIVREYTNSYHDARHVCWAYMIGPERKEWQLNDNGEPSGTAGKPILGQINSLELTDVLVIVVRYFGGIKLGTPGLISAYREAAREALEDAGRLEKVKTEELSFSFGFLSINDVMKIVKGQRLNVLEQNFDNNCTMKVSVPRSLSPDLKGWLSSVPSLSFLDE